MYVNRTENSLPRVAPIQKRSTTNSDGHFVQALEDALVVDTVDLSTPNKDNQKKGYRGSAEDQTATENPPEDSATAEKATEKGLDVSA